MVVHGYIDDKHGLFTYFQTVQRASQRLLFRLATCNPLWTLYVGEVKQTYVQSEVNARRVIYARLPASFSYLKRVLF